MTAIALHPPGAGRPAGPELASDAALARRVAAGDDAAYAAIYARYHERIEPYCRAIVRHDEDASDAAQSAMTKAFVAMRAQGGTVHLRSWLYGIAHNEAVSVLRRRRPHHELTDALEGRDSDPVIEVLLREQLRAMLEALAALPESHRRALLLRELGGLDYATVAEATGLTPRAARQAVFRARRALRADRAAIEHAQCSEIRGVLAGHDGRRRRARKVRAHLRTCEACRDWDTARRPGRPRAVSILPGAWVAAASSLWGWLGGVLGGSSGAVGAVTATKLVTGAATLAAGTGPIARHEIVPRASRPVAQHRATAASATARPRAAAVTAKATAPAPAERAVRAPGGGDAARTARPGRTRIAGGGRPATPTRAAGARRFSPMRADGRGAADEVDASAPRAAAGDVDAAAPRSPTATALRTPTAAVDAAPPRTPAAATAVGTPSAVAASSPMPERAAADPPSVEPAPR
jgi:RNA polymerase sigma factor (sigma-70 family)